MKIEHIKIDLDKIFVERPTKDIYEKCLLDIINEKNKLVFKKENTQEENTQEEYKKLIDEYDKLIENIKIYLSIASK